MEYRTSDEVYECVNRLHRRISEETVLPDGENVTVTAGISSGEKSQFEIIAKKSDEYLYKGKNGGRNCIVWSGNDGEYA